MISKLEIAQSRIRTCRRCVDAGFIPQSAPILRGNAGARIMVIGQAPGPSATERPWPYSGSSGKTLKAWLALAGFGDDALHDPDLFYLTSLTKCFPGKAVQGAGDRAPSRAEINLCSDHLNTELALVQPDLILALGRPSINRMLPSTRKCSLFELVGSVHLAQYPAAGGALILPLPHPSGVSRWLNLSQNRNRLHVALEQLGHERERRGW